MAGEPVQEGGERLAVVRRPVAQVLVEQRGTRRVHPLPQPASPSGGGQQHRPLVRRVGTTGDEVALLQTTDLCAHRGLVDPLRLREFGDTHWSVSDHGS